MGPRAILDAVEKRKIPSLLWESNPNPDSSTQSPGIDREFSITGISCLNINERGSTGPGLYEEVWKVLQRLDIPTQKAARLVTDGTPNMVRRNSDVSSLITNDVKSRTNGGFCNM
jgi:hypothetical protein